ncbi:helix-turn-helix domain-containing protein [Streptomyces roseus]|uniref:helix-turn-helix domain-containing protein n=1 Tax=Streptomyces roseus TaxID=66430 RepID=UPI0036963C6D
MTSERLVRLASLLKLMRRRSGLTQEQLAAESGVSESTIRRLESGRAPNPTLLSLERLQDALGAGPEDRKELAELLASGDGVPAPDGGADGAGAPQPGRLRSPAAPSETLVREEVLSAARDVALEIRRRWRLEEERRRVHDPYPLPVRWRRTDPALSDHEANVERLPPGATAPDPADLGGDLPTVAEFYRRRRSGRLVVLGRAGSGKSVLAIRFVQDFLETRTAPDRVPVIFGIGSWDPTARTLRAWMTERLVRDHPHLADRVAGTSMAGALIEADLVLPVLDGFDEIAEGLRGRALERLNEFSSPLVLTSRREEFAEAVDAAGTPLVWATVIELADLTVDDLAAYLPRTARRSGGPGDHGRGVWDAVTERLRDRSHDGGGTEPLAAALRTPLMTALARTLYGERTETDPAELLDAQAFPDESSIEEHLLAGFVPAVYRRRTPDAEHARDWDPDRAEQWLGYLAHHLAHPDRERQDLAWWEIGDFLPRRQRVLSVALTAALCAALSAWLVGLLIGPLPLWPTLLEGALMGPAAGLAFAAVYGVMIAWGGGTLEPMHVRLRLRPRMPGSGTGGDHRRGAGSPWEGSPGAGVRPPARAPLRVFTARFGAVMAGGFVMGAGCACALAVERQLAYGALVLSLAVLEGAAVNMLVFGLIFGAGTGLVFGLLAAFEAPLDMASAADPMSLLAANRATVRRQLVALVPLLVLSVAFGGGLIVALLDGILGELNWDARDGLYVGAVVGLGGGTAYALSFTAWGRWVVRARLWLPMTGKLPWDTAAFLDDAHRRGVLRQAGAVYQFRHVRLQHHLGRTYRRRQAQRSHRWASVAAAPGAAAGAAPGAAADRG